MSRVKSVNYINLNSDKVAYSSLQGEILVNKNVFTKLNKNERTFVLLHEAGHIELQTQDEHQADAYAFKEYLKLGLPLENIISCMKKVLSNKELNRKRIMYMEKRINNPSQIAAFDGTTGDWLSVIGKLFGIGSQIAGGTSAEQTAEEQAELQAQQELERKKQITFYLGIGGAVALIILIIIMAKK